MNGIPNISPCLRSGTVECNGLWYSWQHSPYSRRARNAKLAALVTVELAALLERLAALPGNSTWYNEQDDDDFGKARAFAASIREALAQEIIE